MRLTKSAVQPVSQRRVEKDLDQDRHGEHRDNERLLQDGLALEREQEHQGRHDPVVIAVGPCCKTSARMGVAPLAPAEQRSMRQEHRALT